MRTGGWGKHNIYSLGGAFRKAKYEIRRWRKNWNRKTRPTESGASEQPNAPQFSKCLEWSGRRDSNPESPDPKSGMLAVTPRPDLYNFKINNRFIVFSDLSLFISIIL